MGIPLLISILSLTLLIFSSFVHPSLSELCNPEDKKVLLQIKKAFNDPYDLASWNPQTDCCNWYCVTCDPKTHRIDSLTVIAPGDLSGPIPAQVGDLPYLKTLEFHKQPKLTGPIPQSITKLKRLSFLRMNWNSLSGPIPDFLGDLKTLTYLDLSFNKFTGPIPRSLPKLPRLTALHLERNKLTGPVPESFREFKGTDLYLSHNSLSGVIPASLGNKDFNYIDLSRNKLEGDPSVLFGSKKTTRHVDLSRNLLEFDLSKVDFPKSLTWLDLNHNKITGRLPMGLTALNLEFLNVSYNNLCGKIPVGGKLQSFDSTVYFHNRCLCGAPLKISCK